jgi:hypothetical protein
MGLAAARSYREEHRATQEEHMHTMVVRMSIDP